MFFERTLISSFEFSSLPLLAFHPHPVQMHPLLVLLLGIGVVVLAIGVFRLHAFLALILASIAVAAVTQPENIGSSIASGFGTMCGKVGIVIAMAAIIGKCLLESGAAERIVLGIRGLFGDRRLSSAFASSSFILGIPVFFDTVFYLLMPLGRAAARRTGKNYLLLVLSIVAGATMAHSLVPPTPGPLLVAESLGVPFLHMVLAGLIVGSFTVTCGLAYAHWANRKWEIPLRPSDLDAEDPTELDPSQLPPMLLSLLPILLPLPLLAGGTLVDFIFGLDKSRPEDLVLPIWAQLLEIFGDKNLALTIAAVAALGVLVRQKSREELPKAIQAALASGGVIILITAAGGAFGLIIKDSSGLIEWLREISPEAKLLVLPIAFGVTTLVRIAQGSATVAMVTAISIVGGLAQNLPFDPVYLALAIGCGSKPIPWMNDSGFWIISRMSGMTTGETLKTASVMMSLMGVAGLIVVMLGAWLLPMSG